MGRNGKALQQIQEEALHEAGFYGIPWKLRGKGFRLEIEVGSHHAILCGSVTSFEISDEGGLTLYVSTPYLFGEPIIGLTRANGKWLVRTRRNDESGSEYVEGAAIEFE